MGMRYAAYALGSVSLAWATIDISGYSINQVTGRSMQPTLNPNSYTTINGKPKISNTLDWVLISKAEGSNICKGEIVTIHNPVVPTDNDIKRVIATENELVKTKSYKNRLLVVPQGYIWVEGDNQAISKDSNCYGPLPASLVFGKAVAIVFPPWRWQWLKPEMPQGSFHQLNASESSDRSIEEE